MTDYKNLIDGEMVDNGEWLDVLNPANEQVVGRVPACGKDELDRAVAAARRSTFFGATHPDSHPVLAPFADNVECVQRVDYPAFQR